MKQQRARRNTHASSGDGGVGVGGTDRASRRLVCWSQEVKVESWLLAREKCVRDFGFRIHDCCLCVNIVFISKPVTSVHKSI